MLHHGSLLDVLPTLEADSFTACVTDPPYELGFMGKKWDGSGVAFKSETWAEVLRVLKPGAHLLAFGGTRTYHRICCAIEDAGFEIRDCIMWIYGSGFPKSLDVSKAIDKEAGAERLPTGQRRADVGMQGGNFAGGARSGVIVLKDTPATDAARLWSGYGTALKPAYEPIIVARKPLSGTVAANCLEHGCGAINVDGCRVEAEPGLAKNWDRRQSQSAKEGRNAMNGGLDTIDLRGYAPSGRWPANIIHDGSDEVLAGFPQSKDGVAVKRNLDGRTYNAHQEWGLKARKSEDAGYGGSGSAARFFYCAKASKSDRGEGNTHPTVKPLKLMEYLVKLVTMPGENRILDPFAGSGTTLVACDNAGIPCVGVELEAEHVAIINARRGANEKKYLFN